jgi:ABC-type transporter Mla MlaB component
MSANGIRRPRGYWWREWLAGLAERAVDGLAQERQTMQAVLRRKQRNDRIRRAEFAELRVLMRRSWCDDTRVASPSGGSMPSDGDGNPLVSRASQSPRFDEGRSRTIEAIALIEAQMAQQWAPRHARVVGHGICAEGGLLPLPAQSSARAGEGPHTMPRADLSLSIDVIDGDQAGVDPYPDGWMNHPVLIEAAVQFANGHMDAARQRLEALISSQGQSPLAYAAGRMLLDLHIACGDVESFQRWAASWAQRFGQPVPSWPGPSAPEGCPASQSHNEPRLWRSPSRLDRDGVLTLIRAMDGADQMAGIDWSALQTIEAEAVDLLADVFDDWARRPLALWWRGWPMLRRQLKAQTSSEQSGARPDWWRLRLAALRLLGMREAFEWACLIRCLSSNAPPPMWRAPTARVWLTETSVSIATATRCEAPTVPTRTAAIRLEGHMVGDISRALMGIEVASRDAMTMCGAGVTGACEPNALGSGLVVDTRELQRIDFAAAGALLQWVLSVRGRGGHVEFDGVSPLIAVLFHVVGIDEMATVRLRQ